MLNTVTIGFFYNKLETPVVPDKQKAASTNLHQQEFDMTKMMQETLSDFGVHSVETVPKAYTFLDASSALQS